MSDSKSGNSSSGTTSPCCPPDSHGPLPSDHVDPNDINGTIVTIPSNSSQESMDMYITDGKQKDASTESLLSAETKRIVVIFSDVFGYNSGRHMIFADNLAKQLNKNKNIVGNDGTSICSSDTIVVVPDLFRGDPPMQPWFTSVSFVPEKAGLLMSLPSMAYKAKYKYNQKYVVSATNDLILPYLGTKCCGDRNENGNGLSFSSVGFCFGTWVVAKAAAIDNVKRDCWKCGVGMHPSFNLEEKLHGGTEVSLAKEIGPFPYFLMPAGNDSQKTKIGGECVRIMANARNVDPSEVSLEFPDMVHGWNTRGDPTEDVKVKDAQLLALNKCVDFIEKHHPI